VSEGDRNIAGAVSDSLLQSQERPFDDLLDTFLDVSAVCTAPAAILL